MKLCSQIICQWNTTCSTLFAKLLGPWDTHINIYNYQYLPYVLRNCTGGCSCHQAGRDLAIINFVNTGIYI